MANECPGNPWLNVVKIAKKEPLWFGKRGEIPFEYEKSDWHKRHIGIGSDTTLRGSGEKHNSPSSEDSWGIGQAVSSSPTSDESGEPSSGGNQRRLNKDLARHLGANEDNRRGRRGNANRHQSFGSTKSGKSDRSKYSSRSRSEADWQQSEMAPPPLRVPSRPGTGHSAVTAVDERAREDAARGITRTASGRVTYMPDGVDNGFAAAVADGLAESADRLRRSLSQSETRPNSSSHGSWTRHRPREAGRGA
jgi:hypothetical protein